MNRVSGRKDEDAPFPPVIADKKDDMLHTIGRKLSFEMVNAVYVFECTSFLAWLTGCDETAYHAAKQSSVIGGSICGHSVRWR